MNKLFALTPLLLIAGACNNPPTSYVCTADVRPGIMVRVEDAVTGAPIAEGATGIAREGDYTEELQITGWENLPSGEQVATTLSGLNERPGTYDVTIDKAGYVPWQAENVRITEGLCHVETVELTAELIADS
ncbi:MAG TPA: hypothetical protein VFI91_05160 [Longimicrobiaceae bacterium]|nr:hypothetical protein [Longimicrobiaceae bacterium]